MVVHLETVPAATAEVEVETNEVVVTMVEAEGATSPGLHKSCEIAFRQWTLARRMLLLFDRRYAGTQHACGTTLRC